MATTSAWSGWVEASTDPNPSGSDTSEWSAWVEATTDAPATSSEYRKVRRSGGWVTIVGRQVRDGGVWV